mmetsp:Transcript_3943/g.10943  ORF Transcript_3943/g.10943 Transcript_3943/m.10943 type:complete len:204 (-) Transcript_3943:1248-1859(-)
MGSGEGGADAQVRGAAARVPRYAALGRDGGRRCKSRRTAGGGRWPRRGWSGRIPRGGTARRSPLPGGGRVDKPVGRTCHREGLSRGCGPRASTGSPAGPHCVVPDGGNEDNAVLPWGERAGIRICRANEAAGRRSIGGRYAPAEVGVPMPGIGVRHDKRGAGDIVQCRILPAFVAHDRRDRGREYPHVAGEVRDLLERPALAY